MSKRTLGVLVLSTLVWSCSGPVATPLAVVAVADLCPDNPINGTLTVGSKVTTGALAAGTLYSDMFDRCASEVSASLSPLLLSGEVIDDGGCRGHQNILQIRACVANHMIEVASSVAQYQFNTTRLVPDGRFLFAQETAKYDIPPSAAASKTCALRLAHRALLDAGLRGVAALTDDLCIKSIVADPREFPGDTRPTTAAELLSVTYGEVVQGFIQTTHDLVENQIAVGSQAAQHAGDFVQSRQRLWNGRENSVRAAAAVLAAADGMGPDVELPFADRPLETDAIENAVGLLRSAPRHEILDAPETPTGDGQVVEAMKAHMEARYPALGYGAMSNDQFLGRFGLIAPQISQARAYLKQEHRVFHRSDLRSPADPQLVPSLGSEPAPLPPAVALAMTAGTRYLASNQDYPYMGALQALDVFRHAARRILRQSDVPAGGSDAFLPGALRPIFSAAATMAEIEVGHMRVMASGGGSLHVFVYGVAATSRLLLVRSVDGLRCVTSGNIEGVPCNPDDYILADTADCSPTCYTAGYDTEQELDGQYHLTVTPTPPTTEPVFIARRNSPVIVLAGFYTTLLSEQVVVTPATAAALFDQDEPTDPPWLHKMLGERTAPSRRTVSYLNIGCADLPSNLSVPLESELTLDAFSMESSWRHYLDLAEQISNETDALGEELIRAGLDLDQMGEAARSELASYCGGAYNVESSIFGPTAAGGGLPENLPSPDPSLATCLPGQAGTQVYPWVTVGSENLCAWIHRDIGSPCVCPSDLLTSAGTAPDWCRRGCPWAKQPDMVTCDLPAEIQDPAPVPDPAFRSHFETIGGSPRIHRLNITDPPTTSLGVVDCKPLAELRTGFHLEATGALTTRPLTTEERQANVEALRAQGWFDYQVLHQVVSNSLYDENWRDDVVLSAFGSTLLSAVASADEGRWTPPCTVTSGSTMWNVLSHAAPGVFPPGGSRGLCGPLDSSRLERTEYADRLYAAFAMLGIIAGPLGEHGKFAYLRPSTSSCDPIAGVANERSCAGTACGGEGCFCLTDGDNAGPGNARCGVGAWAESEFGYTEPFDAAWVNSLWFGYLGHTLAAGVPSSDGMIIFNWEAMVGLPPDTSHPYTICRSSGFNPCGYPTLSVPQMYDALALGCYMAATFGGGEQNIDPNVVPAVRTIGDLARVENYLTSAASAVQTSIGRTILANVPSVVADAVGSRQPPTSLYPGYRGEHLNAMVSLQRDIEEMVRLGDAVAAQIRMAGAATNTVRIQYRANEIQGQISQLQALASIVSTAINAVGSAAAGFGTTSAVSMAGAATFTIFQLMIADLQADVAHLAGAGILTEYAGQVGNIMAEMAQLASQLRETVFALNADLGRIESIQREALSAAARAAFADSDATGRLYPVTTVMRRRYNTLLYRYQASLKRARQMGFIARRAIEQRFGVELEQFDGPLTLVDPPGGPGQSGWADDVCTMQGIDYARIRDANPPADSALAANDDYVDGYIGDYVRKLRLFVESYPFDYPFQDTDDLAVISLRDDIFRSRSLIDVPSDNLLRSSEQVGSGEAWSIVCPGGLRCLELETRVGSEALGLDGRMVTRIADVVAVSDAGDCSVDPARTGLGSVIQDVEVTEAPVDLLLSWRAYAAEPVVAGCPVASRPAVWPWYLVTLCRTEVDSTGATVCSPGYVTGPTDGASATPDREQLVLTIANPGTVRVILQATDSPSFVGDVWFSDLQLEARPAGSSLAATLAPSHYMPTDADGLTGVFGGPDQTGETMRRLHFTRKCEDICPTGFADTCGDAGTVAEERCFWESSFGFTLEQIERGEVIPSGNIALGNFNYRHDQIAVNLVGTNVRDCTRSTAPSTCYSNAFVSYTLSQSGRATIRDYEGQSHQFDFMTGYIEHGKGLTTEMVLTNPLTGAAETLLAPYYHSELHGRPVQGSYRLRIWDDGTVDWNHVEDIQLVFKYRYWTRFDRTW